TFADMAAAWPKKANVDAAHVAMRCEISTDGALQHCKVVSETPRGRAFGAAALKLAPKFRLRMSQGVESGLKDAIVNVPVHFNNPASNTPRGVVEPRWITGLDPAKAQAIFPAKAADAGVTSGKGYVDCTVAADGRLADCNQASAAPDSLGFGEAAVQVASVMQMNPWS